ncbi:SGNH/GDSL hydrolase family protein [Pseudomonas sp.]|uniref:SGNH/GDSL hydrolase family protein n=1 Tax=Pseudomonas sp. TaxID=306 RepID=UPI00271B6739|nr:SGNH/GDSL hydrolase family protein [Pseudomonas sp.]MDO8707087.1 SGNH/GDSL hydrolase family protein [Pseudomonas sp.]
MIIDNSVYYVLGYLSTWMLLVIVSIFVVRLFTIKRRWRWRANIAASFIGIIVFVLMMEGYYGFFYDQTDSYGLTLTSQRWFKRHYILNNLGFRDDKNYYYKKAPGRKRVVFIGDSYTAGHGIKDIRDRFSNQVGQRLSGNSEVYTMALNGWDTGHELRLLNDLIEKGLETDIIVLCFNMNDIGLPSYESYMKMRRINERSPQNWLFKHSFFFNFLYTRMVIFSMPEFKDYFSWVAMDYEGNAWIYEKALLQEFIELCKDNGYELKVAVFPLINDLKSEFRLKAAHEKVSGFFVSKGVPCIDFSQILRKLPKKQLTVNRFDSHPGEFTHSLIAAEIWDRLIGEGGYLLR